MRLSSASPSLEALKEEVRPGHCLCCDTTTRAFKNGRARLICDDPECKKLYAHIYSMDRWAATKRSKETK